MKMVWLRLFFHVRIVSKSPAEFSKHIGAFMEFRSNAILPFSKSGPFISVDCI